jgi:ABC-2 type transport system permease protein
VTGGLSFVWEHFKFNLASAMEYRAGFISQVVFMVLNDMFLLFFWWIVFGRVSNVGGWTFQDVVVLQASMAVSYGLSVSVFGNTPRLPVLIAEGQLDYYMLLPRDPLLHVLVSRSDISGIGDVAFGVGVMVLFGPDGLGPLVVFSMSAAAGAAVFTSFGVIAGSLAFFIGHAQTISQQLAGATITFGGYPEPLFRGIVRVALYSLIPAGFVVYLPARLVRSFDLGTFAVLMAFAAFAMAVAYWMFRRGLSRYESGSLVGTRV